MQPNEYTPLVRDAINKATREKPVMGSQFEPHLKDPQVREIVNYLRTEEFLPIASHPSIGYWKMTTEEDKELTLRHLKSRIRKQLTVIHAIEQNMLIPKPVQLSLTFESVPTT